MCACFIVIRTCSSKWSGECIGWHCQVGDPKARLWEVIRSGRHKKKGLNNVPRQPGQWQKKHAPMESSGKQSQDSARKWPGRIHPLNSAKFVHNRLSVEKPNNVSLDDDDMCTLLQRVLVEFHELRARIDERDAKDERRQRAKSRSLPPDSNIQLETMDHAPPHSGMRFKQLV